VIGRRRASQQMVSPFQSTEEYVCRRDAIVLSLCGHTSAIAGLPSVVFTLSLVTDTECACEVTIFRGFHCRNEQIRGNK
jgi:hypothetical protein